MKLIYVGDPMCSWCYGFGKELTALMQRRPSLELEIVVGGLRAGSTEVLDDSGKRFRLMHWTRVEERSGLPFNREALLARHNFIYNTEPVCRAVVTARSLAPKADLLVVFRALQHAFYAEGIDTTDGSELAKVAVQALTSLGHSIDVEEFYARWKSAGMIAAANEDFIKARKLGVKSFPVLLLELKGNLLEVSPGYAPVAQLDMSLQSLMAENTAT